MSAPVVQQISVKGKLFGNLMVRRILYYMSSEIFISTPPPRRFTNNASALKEADFVSEAKFELLRDNRVEEIISPPDLSPLTVSVQPNGKKRLILDFRHINLHV